MTALPDNAAPISKVTGDKVHFGRISIHPGRVAKKTLVVHEGLSIVCLTLPEARTLLAVLPELIAAMEAGE